MNRKNMINNINAPAGPYATCCMILILEGYTEIGVHVWSDIVYVIRLRYLFRSRPWSQI